MDRGQSSILLTLDLSDAFDNGTLLNRLQISFGITGNAHDWIRSYLSNRKRFVRLGKSCLTESICHTGVLQGSVLGKYFSHSTFHQSHPSSINMESHNNNILTILSSISQCQTWIKDTSVC